MPDALPLAVQAQRVELQNVRRVLSSDRADGMVHARLAAQTVSPSSSKRETRRWIASWDLMPVSERLVLEAAWLSTNGGAQPTFWAPPGEAPLRVHILEWRSATANGLWTIQATLEEAL